MARRKKGAVEDKKIVPRSLTLAAKGVHTGADFASLMAALMSDTIEGRIAPGVSNAVCNAGAKLLKVAEMQFRYGRKVDGMEDRILALTPLAAPSTVLTKPEEVQ